MTTVLHISDTHFGTEQPPVAEALLRLHAQQKPDLVIVSGDITQRARRSQFHAARKFFSQMATPTVIIPGNHDIPLFNLALRLFAPYANYTRAFGENLEPEFLSDDLLVVGLNSTRPRRRVNGEISSEQIRSVCDRVTRAPSDQLKIVVIHHPVLVITPSDDCNLLRGYRDAIHAWSDAGVDLILGGHIHLPYVRSLCGENFSRPLWVAQAGTAVSWRIRSDAPNSVNIIRYDKETRACNVEQWDYARQRDTFQRTQSTALELARN